MGFTLSDFLRTRIHALRQPAPLLQFYELSLQDGSFFRAVDFADPEAGGSLPDRIPFNGEEFVTMPITRGDLQEASQGSTFQLPVTVSDPLHQVAFYVRQFQGLRGRRVRLWIAAQDNLENPADALSDVFEVITSEIGQGPDRVTLILGHPNLYEAKVPKLYYSRSKCINPYHDRFVPGSWCTYPSNEFGEQSRQDLVPAAGFGVQAWKHGWSSQQARRASVFDSDRTNAGDLTITTSTDRIAWKARERYGPNLFRVLTGDLDVSTVLTLPATSRVGWMAGLVLQDTADAMPPVAPGEEPPVEPLSTWLAFAAQDNGAGGRRLLLRRTIASEADPDDTEASTDLHLRLLRSGNVVTCYSRDSEDDDWTERFLTTLTVPAAARIGVVAASDTKSALGFTARFNYLRFAAGGLATCARTEADCDVHENLLQFNGFLGMPNDRSRY